MSDTVEAQRIHRLSKSRILEHRQCAKRLWLRTFKPDEAEEDAAAAARLSSGTEVGTVARTLFPAGILIGGDDLQRAIDETRTVLAEQPQRPIFEATFEHDGVLIRADILIPASRGYRLVEVKSSAGVKDYHLTDAAVQAWVARSAGVELQSVEIAHIDTTFMYAGGGQYRGLFAEQDVSVETAAQQNDVPQWVQAARTTLAGPEPEIATGDHCETPFACPFRSYCASREKIDATAFPVETLPRAKRLAEKLRADGYADLRHVPEERLANPVHQRMRRASLADRAELEAEAGRTLAALPYPRYYLDFETLPSAVPIWAGTRPYMQIPFQWSCHVEAEPVQLAHAEFLAEGTDDPRRAFAESLLRTLGARGPILVYNAAFERTRLSELGEAFPDLAQRLRAVARRIVDLLPLARAHYYHPAMNGSWSLKVVLPTIAPELDYGALDVADGGMAQQAFRALLSGRLDNDRRAALRRALLEYCARDTLGAFRIARYFIEGAGHAA